MIPVPILQMTELRPKCDYLSDVTWRVGGPLAIRAQVSRMLSEPLLGLLGSEGRGHSGWFS